MRRLWIHIGHDKTGSSYLQALFARNVELLAEHGISYPVTSQARDDAAAGLPSSGTGHDETLDERLAACPADRDVLLSSEGFFGTLAQQPDEELARWQQWRERFGFDEIQVLLFTRDPVGHAVSGYMQRVRANGASLSLDEHMSRYNRPRLVLRVLNSLQKVDGLSVQLCNYSRVRDTLAAEVLQWLPLPRGLDFAEAPDEVVNRGLTDAELVLTRGINRLSPALGSTLALLCSRYYPDLGAARPAPSAQAQSDMLGRNLQAMEAIGAGRGDKGRYLDDSREPAEASPGSLALLATALRMALASLRHLAHVVGGK